MKPILTIVLHRHCVMMVSVKMASITLLVTAMQDILEGCAMSILMIVRVGTRPLGCALISSFDFCKMLKKNTHTKTNNSDVLNKINKARLKKVKLYTIS